jgi:hypothetical protein
VTERELARNFITEKSDADPIRSDRTLRANGAPIQAKFFFFGSSLAAAGGGTRWIDEKREPFA